MTGTLDPLCPLRDMLNRRSINHFGVNSCMIMKRVLVYYVISVMPLYVSMKEINNHQIGHSYIAYTRSQQNTPTPAILSSLPFLRKPVSVLSRRMPTAILPTSPGAINKQAMSTIPKTNFGAGGKALPDTYKYVPFFS